MKKYFLTAIALATLWACQNTNNEFLISNTNIGALQKNTLVQQLDSIFAKDSIVSSNVEGELRYASAERIMIFDKQGKELLEITPTTNDKGQKVIESVLVLSPQYTTEKGISLGSTFKELKEKYPNLEIEASIISVMITPKGQNFYFTLPKSALKSAFNLGDTISKEQIDENAKIECITLNF